MRTAHLNNQRPWHRALLPVSLCAAIAGAGCARPAGVIFPPENGGLRWPPPPDQPRVQYVGELKTDQDLKPALKPGKALSQALWGKEPAHSLLSPMALCTDGGSRVFVADSNAQTLHVFDLGSRRYQRWNPPEKQARFSQPVDVAWDPSGRILVADPVAGVIFSFSADGAYLGTIGGGIVGRPCGLAVAPDGRLFASDVANHRIAILSRDGTSLGTIGQRGTGPGEFNYPTYLALDARGRLYVSDSLNFRVQVFGPDLKPLRQIGTKGDMPGYFSQPKGVSVDAAGRLFVVDAHFEAVQLFDPEGTLLMSFGREGRAPGEFWLPVGVHADGSGRIWVADSYNRRIQVFRTLEPKAGSTP